jgi:hypothetical protein
MNTTKWRKGERYVVDNPEINTLENFALDTQLKKQISQNPSEQKTASIQITQTEPTRITEILPQEQNQIYKPDLPSEIVQFCYNGRPAEFRMYGGLIKYLDE